VYKDMEEFPEPIGFMNGAPVYPMHGAVGHNDVEDWIPEEWGGAVIQRIQRTSAVESVARHEVMGTDTKHVRRRHERQRHGSADGPQARSGDRPG